MMLPTSHPQQDPLPGVVLEGSWAVPGHECMAQLSPSVGGRAGAPTIGDVNSAMS